jgi:hypothetical protein
MNKGLPLQLLLGSGLALPGCFPPPQQAYFASPVHGYSDEYHPLPRLTDTAHTAVYAQAGYFTGNANTLERDNLNAFHGSVTIAHHSGIFQAWYGGDLNLGNYNMGHWDTTRDLQFSPPQSSVPFNAEILNSYSGSHFFGAAGFHGGANFVLPTGSGEWRIIGMEGSFNHEFGKYLDIRQQLPDTVASIIARGANYGTLGIYTELVGSSKNGEFGFRMGLGRALGQPYWNPNVYDYKSAHYITYRYFNMGAHYTHGIYTFYGQLNFATKTDGASLGIAFRLNKPRIAPARTSHKREVPYKNEVRPNK